jgi:hypothetical protein
MMIHTFALDQTVTRLGSRSSGSDWRQFNIDVANSTVVGSDAGHLVFLDSCKNRAPTDRF